MAINQNHLSEELNGVECAIVEKNVSAERASFLKQLLIFNKYTVEIAASPPPKTAAPVPVKEGETVPARSNKPRLELPKTTLSSPSDTSISI